MSNFCRTFVAGMQYSVIHMHYQFEEEWQKDLFEQSLCDMGCETFDDADAYIQTIILEGQEETIKNHILQTKGVTLLGIEACEDKNWNATWEAEHETIELPMGVRITPHCAFGAGHHETTRMMIEALLEAQESGWMDTTRQVLDMGCGTGVLGIMAKRCGAEYVVAVDIDDKSVANAQENATANGVRMDVRLASTPPDETFDLILANIHRNILIEHMPHYARALKENGELWLSGFYEDDIAYLQAAAEKEGLAMVEKRSDKEWRMIKLKATSRGTFI